MALVYRALDQVQLLAAEDVDAAVSLVVSAPTADNPNLWLLLLLPYPLPRRRWHQRRRDPAIILVPEAARMCGVRRQPAVTAGAAECYRRRTGANVIRTDDLALRHAIQARCGLDHLPGPSEVADLARNWRPFRSLASSLLLAAARSG